MATREHMLDGVYVSETGTRDEILAPGVYLSETVPAAKTYAAFSIPQDVGRLRPRMMGY